METTQGNGKSRDMKQRKCEHCECLVDTYFTFGDHEMLCAECLQRLYGIPATHPIFDDL